MGCFMLLDSEFEKCFFYEIYFSLCYLFLRLCYATVSALWKRSRLVKISKTKSEIFLPEFHTFFLSSYEKQKKAGALEFSSAATGGSLGNLSLKWSTRFSVLF